MASAYLDENDHVLLALSPDEAQFLADVLSKVGGNPATTRRYHVEPVLEALYTVGYRYYSENERLRDYEGRLYFKEPRRTPGHG